MPPLEKSPFRPFLLGKRKCILPFAEIQAAQKILVTIGNDAGFQIPDYSYLKDPEKTLEGPR